MTDEKIKNLYMYFLDNGEITKAELDVMGFNELEINDLLQQKILVKNLEYYYINDSNSYYTYGKAFSDSRRYNMAIACFKKCYEMNDTNLDACKQAMLIALKTKDNDTFMSFLEILLHHNKNIVRTDAKFYLYLYSWIEKIPNEYIPEVKNMDYYDVQISFSNHGYFDAIKYNQVRTAALTRSFAKAIHLLNNLIAQHDEITIDESLTKTLLSMAADQTKQKQAVLLGLVAKEDYLGVIRTLTERLKYHNLIKGEIATSDIAMRLLNNTLIQKDIINPSDSEDIFNVIARSDYRLAYAISDKRLSRFNACKEKSLLNAVLKKAIRHLDEAESNKTTLSSSKEVPNKTLIDSINELRSFLMQKDVASFKKTLNQILTEYNLLGYERIIVAMFNICILENDYICKKAFNMIINMAEYSYVFNSKDYLIKFKKALEINDFAIAKCYLDILSEGEILGYIDYASTLKDEFTKCLKQDSKEKESRERV